MEVIEVGNQTERLRVHIEEYPTKEQLRILLTQVKSQIRSHPRDYNQFSLCGTQCCIAGWICKTLTGEPVTNPHKATDLAKWCFGGELPWLLGVVDAWPVDLEESWMGAGTPEERAEVGCRAVDRWMGENGV